MPKAPKENVIKKSPNAPTVLLAGGAGFIGSHLAEVLLLNGARVIVLDNFTTGKDVYINSLKSNPNFGFFHADINKAIPSNIESVDYIIHLASVETYLSNYDTADLHSLLTNALGTKNLLDLANKSDAKFLLASSIYVYQGIISSVNLDHYFGQTEEEEKKYSLTEAKRYAEALTWEYYQRYATNARIVRLPEVYGPRMNFNSTGSLGTMLKDLMDNHKLAVYGDGTEKEYYLYITDAVSGIVKALFEKDTEGNIYTLAENDPRAVLETTYLVKSLADRNIEVEFKQRSPGPAPEDPRIPNRGPVEKLNWEPKIAFKDGLIKTLKWYGYDVNTHSFKLNKLVDQNKKSKAVKAQVFSLTGGEKDRKDSNSGNGSENETLSDKIKSLFGKKDSPKNNKDKASNENKKADENPFQIQEPAAENPSELEKNAPAAQPTQAPRPAPGPAPAPAPKPAPTPAPSPAPALAPIPTKTLATDAATSTEAQNKPSQPKIHEIYRQPITKPKKKYILKNLPVLKKVNLMAILPILITVVFVFTILPVIQTYYYINSAKNEMESYANSMIALNPEEAIIASDNAFKDLNSAQTALARVSWLFSTANKKDTFDTTQSLLGSAIYFTKTLYNGAKGSEPFIQIWESIESNSATTLDDAEILQSQLSLAEAKNSLQLAQAEVQQVNIEDLPNSMKEEASMYIEVLNLANDNIDAVETLTDELPELLGINEPKRYLILFQNSNEIRPTGGFIGSYAELEMSNGKIDNLIIDDIYNPDGQIDIRQIAIEPPAPVKEFLGEEVLHIRNANWDPNFVRSANQITSLMFQVDGRTYDGVFAVDLHFAKELLKVTGPIYLTAYNEEIDYENMYEITQYHSEFNYEDGSDQKKSFLTVFGSKLLEKLLALPREDLSVLVSTVMNSLNERHLQVYLPDTQLDAFLSEKGWTGELIRTNDDYLYVVNANVGGTKANYYISNTMNYNVTSKTRDGLLRAELELKYDHTQNENAWPGGPYTNYVRVITQKGTKLTGAKLLGPNGLEQDIFDQIVISNISGYTSFETNFTIQPQENISVVLNYDLPLNLSITDIHKEYELYWQKQAGTHNDAFNVRFSAPFGTEITQVQPEPQNRQDRIVEYGGFLNKDQQYYVKID